MKVGMLVFFVCLTIGTVGGVIMFLNTQTRIHESQNLVLGLTYFMETHDGRLPASADDFLNSEYVERLPRAEAADTTTPIRIKPPTSSRFRRDVRDIPIRDLSVYQIAWGLDPGALQPDAKGELRDEKGNKIRLFAWPDGSWGGNEYGQMLLKASLAIREPAASRPAQTAGG